MWRKYTGSIPLLVFSLFIFLLLPLIYSDSTLDPELTPRILITSAFLVIISIYFFISNRNNIQSDKNGKNILIVVSLILFWMIISAFFSVNTGDAVSEWLRMAVLYGIFILLLLTFNQLTEPWILLSRASAFSIIIFSVVGLIQFIPILRDYLQDKTSHLVFVMPSTLSNKNFFSEVLVLTLPLLLNGIFNDKKKWKALFIITIVIDLTFIGLLQTASAWIALIFSILFFAIGAKTRQITVINSTLVRKKFLALTFFFFLFLFFGFIAFTYTSGYKLLKSKAERTYEYILNPELLSQTRIENNNSVFERLVIWRNSIRMIRDYPVLGVGLNNWKLLNPSYGISGTQFINSGFINYEHPHNDYLLIWAEQGPIGILLYLILFVLIIRAGIQKIKVSEDSSKRILLLLLCGVVEFMTLSLFAYPRSRFYPMILLMIYFSAIVSFPSPGIFKTYSLKPFLIIVFLISIFGTVAAGYRYSGEVHSKNLVIAQVNRNYSRMLREADKAYSWFYPIDMTATPIDWFKGMAYYYKGDVLSAKHEYESAIRYNPNHLRLINDLATACEQSGEREKAIYYYRKALSITPLFIEANLNLSAAYFNQDKIDSSFYFIDKIYHLPMSMGEEKNYRTFLEAILMAKARSDLKLIKDSVLFNKISLIIADNTLLNKIYNDSKDKNKSFTEYLFSFGNR